MNRIKSFFEIANRAYLAGKRTIAIPLPHSGEIIRSLVAARDRKLVNGILIGNKKLIEDLFRKINKKPGRFEIYDIGEEKEAVDFAVEMVRMGRADILMKGNLHTSIFMKSVLDKDKGLRTGRILSDFFIFEDNYRRESRLLALADCGLNISPEIEEKKHIIENSVEFLQALGFKHPRVAILSAVEVVNPDIRSTLHGEELTRMNREGEIKGCDLFGPLAMDNVLFEECARAKGIDNPVAGNPDLIIVPGVDTGNSIAKIFTFYIKAPCGHLVLGARKPILIPSRAENALSRFNSILLAIIASAIRVSEATALP